jgi:hypothetical protein
VRRFDDVSVAHVDLVEHGSVEKPSRPVAATPVCGGAAGGEPQGELHDLLPVVEPRVEDGLTGRDGPQLGTDAPLVLVVAALRCLDACHHMAILAHVRRERCRATLARKRAWSMVAKSTPTNAPATPSWPSTSRLTSV